MQYSSFVVGPIGKCIKKSQLGLLSKSGSQELLRQNLRLRKRLKRGRRRLSSKKNQQLGI